MDDIALLDALAVPPTVLDEVSQKPDTAAARARYGRPCSTCGLPSVATTTVTLPGGRFWLDSCRNHMIAAARLRSTPAS